MRYEKIGPFEVIVTEECPPDRLYMVPQLQREPWETNEQYWRRVAKNSACIRIGHTDGQTG